MFTLTLWEEEERKEEVCGSFLFLKTGIHITTIIKSHA